MNTETPKKSKFDILEEIMINFQNDKYKGGKS